LSFSTEKELDQWVSEAERLWLFLDYDGTLVEFSHSPAIIQPVPQVIDLVKKLAEKKRIRVAVVSGRSLHNIQTLLPVEGIFIAGTYGIELITPEGERIQREDYSLIRPYLERLKPQWQEIIAGRKGYYLEDKGWALALHARFAPEQEATRLISTIQQTLDQELITDEFRLIKQKKFIEVSTAKAHKGKTVSFLLNSFPLPGARLLYLGDDTNDAEAFETIHANGGVAVAVAQYFGYIRSSGGDYVMKSPKQVRRWLEKLSGWF
jgi:trehalose-phosphatase